MKFVHKTRLLLLACMLLTYCGCNPEKSVLKGTYASNPFEVVSSLPADTIWAGLTQLFAENSIAIKKVDKERGIIISKTSGFDPVYSFEDTAGVLISAKAWVVLKRVILKHSNWDPKNIHGEWSIRISETANHTRKIAID